MSIYKTSKTDPNTYWATWQAVDLLPHLMHKINDYYAYLENMNVLSLWDDVYKSYYTLDDVAGHVGSRLQFAGKHGENVLVRVNLLRNFIKHTQNLISSMQPSVTPIASNDEWQTKAQVISCKAIIEHIDRQSQVTAEFKKTLETASLYGLGYIVAYWDEDKHDWNITSATPRDIIRSTDNARPQWYIYIERVNRYDCAERYNTPLDTLDQLTNVNQSVSLDSATNGYYFDDLNSDSSRDQDYIDIYHFFHEPCPSLPYGRYTIFANDKISFTDHLKETLPFSSLPVHEYKPSPIKHTWLGYGIAFDLIGPQKLYNAVLSNIITALDRARTIIAAPIGSIRNDSDPSLTFLETPIGANGLGLQQTSTLVLPQQYFTILELVGSLAQQLSGLNSTIMGGSDAKSGAHAALLFSTATQFQSDEIASYYKLIERVWSAILKQIQGFMDEPLMIKIAGADKSMYIREFKRDSISSIEGVVYAQGISPLLSTPSGRMSVAQDLMKLPNSPLDIYSYLKLLDTGTVDPSLNGPRDEDMELSIETDALSSYENLTIVSTQLTRFTGQVDTIDVVKEVRASIADNHKRHLQHHTRQLNTPKIRNNQDLMHVWFAHCFEHIWLSTYGSRQMLLASGQEPMPDFNAQQANQSQPSQPTQPKSIPVSRIPNISSTAEVTGPLNAKLPSQPVNPLNKPLNVEMPNASSLGQ